VEREREREGEITKQFAANLVVDGKGLIVAPGFIDLQINGGFSLTQTNKY